MPKEFYTERDIEDMFKRGTTALELSDDVVLTELAYEKAKRLGVQAHRPARYASRCAGQAVYRQTRRAASPARPLCRLSRKNCGNASTRQLRQSSEPRWTPPCWMPSSTASWQPWKGNKPCYLAGLKERRSARSNIPARRG